MTLQEIINKIKVDFAYIENFNLKFSKEIILNKDDENAISIRLITNEYNYRKIYLTIYPRKIIQITFAISNTIKTVYSLIQIKEYLNFKAGNEPKFIPMEELDKNNFDQSLRDYAAKIEFLLENELKEIVNGNEWIDIPSYDPREQK